MLIAFQKDWTLSGYSEKKMILQIPNLVKFHTAKGELVNNSNDNNNIILEKNKNNNRRKDHNFQFKVWFLKKLFLLHVAAKLAPLAELKTPQLFLKYLSHSFSSSLDSYVLLTAYNEKVRAHACHGGTSCALTCQSCVLSLTFHQRASWF